MLYSLRKTCLSVSLVPLWLFLPAIDVLRRERGTNEALFINFLVSQILKVAVKAFAYVMKAKVDGHLNEVETAVADRNIF